jgi:hypothetical protein
VLKFAEEKDLLVSGMLAGGRELAGKPAIVQAPSGKGHYLLFAINPMWRNQTQGSFMFLLNAAMHYDHLHLGAGETGATMIRFALAFSDASAVVAGDTALVSPGSGWRPTASSATASVTSCTSAAGGLNSDAAEVASVEHAPEPASRRRHRPKPRRVLTPKELVTEAARRHGLPPKSSSTASR